MSEAQLQLQHVYCSAFQYEHQTSFESIAPIAAIDSEFDDRIKKVQTAITDILPGQVYSIKSITGEVFLELNSTTCTLLVW